MDILQVKDGILFHDDQLYTPGSVIATTEGICHADSPVKLPNFHAVQYYTSVPYPAILCYVLDFGITVRTEIDDFYRQLREKDPAQFLERIEAELNKSFKDTSREVASYLLYRMMQFDDTSLYVNAVPGQGDGNDPWNIFITRSRELKDHNAKKSFARWLRERLEIDKNDITDATVLGSYNHMIDHLSRLERTYDAGLYRQIKAIITGIHLREQVPGYLNAIADKVIYTKKIQVAA